MNGLSSVGLLLGALWLNAAERPQWEMDYGTALRQAAMEESPLLVVLDNPLNQAQRLEFVSSSKDQVEAALLASYKLCYIDVSTPYGKRLAKAFDATAFPHTVVIDKSAGWQIYRHSGQLTREQFASVLVHYRDGERGKKSIEAKVRYSGYSSSSSRSSSRFGRACPT